MGRYFVFWKAYVKTTQDMNTSDLRSHIGWANATPQFYIDSELGPLWPWVVYISQVPLYGVTLSPPCFLFPQVSAVSAMLMNVWPPSAQQCNLQELTACVNSTKTTANPIPASAAAGTSAPWLGSGVIARLATRNRVVRPLWICPCFSNVVNWRCGLCAADQWFLLPL